MEQPNSHGIVTISRDDLIESRGLHITPRDSAFTQHLTVAYKGIIESITTK
ncbi:hypothetical protein SAMN04488072_10784 [Lentibacillus halodurans]|uniref:Uncharacterized protein n=1 Tax=Lentibacillus halodurans TaxID=237679 RepID=A0A1I0YF11_9BACI|nr:hypothetical protein [Lentibacillus halodurans]SFB11346.1 hypothetical protein SAMN04488072_10784 [Lentibacillus halodurans]